MPRLLGVDIPNDKPTAFSLRYLYGVGDKVALELCHKAGIDPTKHARDPINFGVSDSFSDADFGIDSDP